MERYERIELIGEGSHGEVWKVQTRSGIRALKIAREDAIENIMQESMILQSLTHPSIPSFYAFERDEQSAYMMMEWMEGSPLSSICKEEIVEQQLQTYALQLVDILLYLHTKGVLYLDLKLENILITPKQTIQLVDFSCAQRKDEQNPILHYGTKGYAPPEQHIEGYLDERADIYAFGKVMMALSLGITDGGLLESYCTEDVMCSEQLQRIIKGCTQAKKEERWQSTILLQQELQELVVKTATMRQNVEAALFPKLLLWIVMSILLCGCHIRL